jgi:hypothetical protein
MIANKTESKGSIASSAIPKMPSLRQENDFDSLMKNKAHLEKRYAEIDQKAE